MVYRIKQNYKCFFNYKKFVNIYLTVTKLIKNCLIITKILMVVELFQNYRIVFKYRKSYCENLLQFVLFEIGLWIFHFNGVTGSQRTSSRHRYFFKIAATDDSDILYKYVVVNGIKIFTYQ